MVSQSLEFNIGVDSLLAECMQSWWRDGTQQIIGRNVNVMIAR